MARERRTKGEGTLLEADPPNRRFTADPKSTIYSPILYVHISVRVTRKIQNADVRNHWRKPWKIMTRPESVARKFRTRNQGRR